jgi:hypothetical protein
MRSLYLRQARLSISEDFTEKSGMSLQAVIIANLHRRKPALLFLFRKGG